MNIPIRFSWRPWRLGGSVVLFFLGALPGFAQQSVPGGAKVLLLSGGQRGHHGYRRQAYGLQHLLESTRKFEVTLCEDAAILETPALRKYDVIVMNADRRDREFGLTVKQQEALLAFVRGGKGFVSIHGADNAAVGRAAPDWVPEMKQMLGGIFSHHGQPNSQPRIGDYEVKIVDPKDPITRGIHDFRIHDELYSNLQMLPDAKPLAVVSFAGHDWPVAWKRRYGKGRVFHTPLGHTGIAETAADPITNPSFQKLLIQGIEWAAGGRRPGRTRPKMP